METFFSGPVYASIFSRKPKGESATSAKKYVSAMLAAAAATLVLATSAQAARVGRDINGIAVAGSSADAVFLYDIDLNITWLRDANAG